jgi:hypothetical protein
MGYEQEHEGREEEMDELRRVAGNHAEHNYELKQLILRHGDVNMKSRLTKLMKKYSGNCHFQPNKDMRLRYIE